jgi:putative N6-adenine-specific DNA methylase
MTSASFEKRIKRQIIAKEHLFFAATTSGLKSICCKELNNLSGSFKEIRMVDGGVEFTGRIQDCYKANLYLRTANRILMRMGSLKASNFRILEKKLLQFPWELFLSFKKNILPEINVTAKHSRLYHTKAVADCFKKCIAIRFSSITDSHNGENACLQQKLLIRIRNDHFFISIDSSGELLHKRGIKKHNHMAPIRETIAVAALMIAGYEPGAPLLDPLCGSGTFSIEGAMLTSNTPPGWFRSFAFMSWPSFRPAQWDYLKREAGKNISIEGPCHIFASDINFEACSRLSDILKAKNLSAIARADQKDFFSFLPSDIFEETGLIILNPPYGLRMGNKHKSENMLKDILHKLRTGYVGWKYALVVPRNAIPKKKLPYSSSHPFRHGGLDMVLLTGKIA